MSQIQIQQSKYEKYARALETTQFIQCKGIYGGGKFRCALGVIMSDLYGWKPEDTRPSDVFGKMSYDGIDSNKRYEIWSLNDFNGMTFQEIADWLREQK